MYWLQPPPYWRRAAAVALVLGAVLWDLRSAPTEPHPFAARDVAAGSVIEASDVEWRSLPVGSFEVPSLTATVAAVDVWAGDPISGSVLAGPVAVPDGWWAVPIQMAAPTAPGSPVLLVVTDPPVTVPGIVVSSQRGDRYSLDHTPAVVAVPGQMAPLVAAAERAGFLVTATRP